MEMMNHPPPMDHAPACSEPTEQEKRLIRERRVEIFLQLERSRKRHAPVSRERAMRGTAFKALYYIIGALFFLLYGALI